MSIRFDVSGRVRRALDDAAPVVALETTVLSHGLPWPHNLEAARSMERAVTERAATPAFVGVLDGVVRVGLDAAEVERFARGEDVSKASRRDLGPVAARGGSAATTVAGTMACAHRAGIGVFATGGIGGVHRGAERSFDVSADLQELARTPVAVVCSGAKSILDLPATLELLETLGVPVLGYGVGELPAFHARSSGLALEHAVASATEAAAAIAAHWAMGGAGLVLANPVPAAQAIPAEALGGWLDEALAAAAREGVAGKAVTPWLLGRLASASGGATLPANLALLEANAGVAADVAVELVAALARSAS